MKGFALAHFRLLSHIEMYLMIIHNPNVNLAYCMFTSNGKLCLEINYVLRRCSLCMLLRKLYHLMSFYSMLVFYFSIGNNEISAFQS